MPDFDTLAPAMTRGADVISYTSEEIFSWRVADVPLRNDFALRITGTLTVDTAGQHTFYLTSGDGSHLLVDGKRVVDNGGTHATQERRATVALSAGAHRIEVQYFQRDAGVVLSLEWETPADMRRLIPATHLGGDRNAAAGLPTEIYQFTRYWDGMAMPDLASRTPVALARVGSVSFASLAEMESLGSGEPMQTNFGMRMSGSLKVDVSGVYSFMLTADDGALLFIDGALIVNNTGTVVPQEILSSTQLGVGWHSIVVLYFQVEGEAGLTLEWEANGIPRAVVPASALWDGPSYVAEPCDLHTKVLDVSTVSTFNQGPLTFGGEMLMRATVNLNRYTAYSRVMDFGNGPATNNVVVALSPGQTGFFLQVISSAGAKNIFCNAAVPLNRDVLLEVTIAGSGSDGVGTMYVDGVQCASGPMNVPEIEQRTGTYIKQSHWADPILDGAVSNFVLSYCIPATPAPPTAAPTPVPVTSAPPVYIAAPCEAPVTTLDVSTVSTFNQGPLTFGGEMLMRATVNLNRYTAYSRVMDLGNGPATNNVVVALSPGQTGFFLQVISSAGAKNIFCNAAVPLNRDILLEVTITGSGSDGVGTMYVDGVQCVSGPMNVPDVEQRTGTYIKQSHWGDPILDGTVSDFKLYSCHMRSAPCEAPVTTLDVSTVSTFIQGPLTFGGEMLMRATVNLNRYTAYSRVMDFGNGPATNNVVVALSPGQTGFFLQVFSSAGVKSIVCNTAVPLNRDVLLEVTIARSGSDGVGTMYVDGVQCVSGPMNVPDVEQRTGTYIKQSHWADPILDGTVSDFKLYSCHMRSAPCEAPVTTLDVSTVSTFNQGPLTFGGEMLMRATVNLNRYTAYSRVMDFGNGPATNNVVVALSPGQTGFFLQVISSAGVKSIVCNAAVPLNRDVLLEVTIARSGSDVVGTIYIDGAQCVSGPMNVPEIEQRTGTYIKQSHWADPILDGTVSDFKLLSCPNPTPTPAPTPAPTTRPPPPAYVPAPCDVPRPVVFFDTLAEADLGPLTFGGEMLVRATVKLESFVRWGRVMDFGNGPETNNVLITLQEGTQNIALHVWRAGVTSQLVCPTPLPLNRDFLLEVTIAGSLGAVGVGTIYIDGVKCISGPILVPDSERHATTYIGKSLWGDADLDGTVTNFRMFRCPVPGVPDVPGSPSTECSAGDSAECQSSTFVGSARRIAFSPDGKRLAASFISGPIVIYDATTFDRVLLLVRPHAYWTASMAWSPDGRRLVTSGAESTRVISGQPSQSEHFVRVWDMETGLQLLEVGLAWKAESPDTNFFGSRSHTSDTAMLLAYSADGNTIASLGPSGLQLWDAWDGNLMKSAPATRTAPSGLSYSADGKALLLSGMVDDGVWEYNVYDVVTMQPLLSITPPLLPTPAQWSTDGTQLVGVGLQGASGVIHGYNAQTGVEEYTVAGIRHAHFRQQMAFSRNRLAVWGSQSTDPNVMVYDTQTGAVLHTLVGHTQFTLSLAFSADGSKLATAASDGRIRIWNVGV